MKPNQNILSSKTFLSNFQVNLKKHYSSKINTRVGKGFGVGTGILSFKSLFILHKA